MIRIASERTERRKGMAASRQEDAATWPTNKPPSKVARARSTQAAQREIEAAAVKIPAPLTHKHHGTDHKKEDTLQTAVDVTLLTSRYALLSLVSSLLTPAGDAPANAPANRRAVSKREASSQKPHRKGKSANPALLIAEAGSEATRSLVNVARTKPQSEARRAYMADLMRKRRAAERLANVIV